MHGHKPEVSVVIPAYRAREFIATAINSALDQRGTEVEILVIDDASPDGTADFVASTYAGDARVSVIRQPRNGGPSVARNAGLHKARAPWIAVLDADDAFEPGRLRRLVDDAIEHEADVIADNIRFYDAQQGTVSEPQLTSLKVATMITVYDFVARALPSAPEMDLGLLKPMYRKEFLLKTGLKYPVYIRHGEDFTLYFELLRAGARFILSPGIGYRWTLRNSGNSQTTEDYTAQRREALRLARAASNDTKLASLLRTRAGELLRLHFTRRTDAAKRSKRPVALLRLAVQYPQFSIPRYTRAAFRSLIRAVRPEGHAGNH